MSKLHAQLAVFGAIDQEVVAAKKRLRAGASGDNAATDAAVIDMVEGFLPGTTRFGQHGWYAQLVTFLNAKSKRPAPAASEPDPAQEVSVARFAQDEGAPPAPPVVNFPELEAALDELETSISHEDDERDPVLARAAYGAVVLSKIYHRLERSGVDPLRILPRALGGWPQEGVGSPAEELEKRIPYIANRQDWVPEVRNAVSDEFAEGSRPCFGALKKVDGQYCAYITTDISDDTLKVKDIAKIVEPINWNLCCKFFCKMIKPTSASDQYTPKGSSQGEGWNRLTERISGECDEYHLDTPLVFWKEQLPDGSIFINYDLDPKRKKDECLVEVDSGYIWVSPLAPTGVRIRTSKLERVSGLSPTATAALACLMGWGDTGKEMLAGTARAYMKDPLKQPPVKPFKRSPNDKDPFKE
jgi:hypothetical protein